MFESRPWQPVGLLEGPVPLAPGCLAPEELLGWARRAPLSGVWVDALLALDPGSLSPGSRLDLAVAWERVRRGLDAVFTDTLGSVPARACAAEDLGCGGAPGGGLGCGHDWSREDTAAALGIGPRHAAGLLAESRELRGRLPFVLAAVAEGTVSMGHARRLAGRTVHVEDERLVRMVAAHVLPMAGSRTVGAFDRLVVATLDRLRGPLEALRAHEEARRGRTGIFPCQPMAEGMAGATLIGPAEQIAELFAWARQFTRRNRADDDPRTVGQRRLDALLAGILNTASEAERSGDPDREPGPVDTAAGSHTAHGRDSAADGATADGGWGDAGPTAGTRPGRAPDRDLRRGRVALQLVLSAATLLGANNDPGWLEGHGEISAALARQLAVDPVSIERLLVHPLTGELLDLSPRARFPHAALARFVKTRDRTCTAPGCGAQAAHLDLDHIEEYSRGGRTVRLNLHAVCERHHRLRHAGGWTLTRHPDGIQTWTDTTGRAYRTEGTPQRPPPVIAFWPDPGTGGDSDSRHVEIDDDWDALEEPPPRPGPTGSGPPPPGDPTNRPPRGTAPPDDGEACPF